MRTGFAVILAALVGGGSAIAHHSYGDVLREQSVSVEGTLDGFFYANPHVMLSIKTANSGTYSAEWQTIQQLTRAGVTKGTLKAGDPIVVTGSPMRDPEVHQLKLLTEIRRPTDGWLWSLPLGRRGGPALPEGSVNSRTIK